MFPFDRIVFYLFLAAVLWIADSLLFSFSTGHSFWNSLWSAVSGGRLLIRLGSVVVLVLSGFMDILRREVQVKQYKKLSPVSKRYLFGAPDSADMSERMQYHALRLAAVMHMRRKEQERLRLLCYCYDLGSFFADDESHITHGHISTWDRYMMNKHADIGADIAAKIPQIASASKLISCHEENYDGSGPKGLFGRGIPLACRIFRLVQLYDYFTQPSEDRGAMTTQEALDELSFYSGTLLDPDVLKAFHKLMSDDSLGERAMAQIFINS